MTDKEFFEVIDGFDTDNEPIKCIRDNQTTEIYSMDNETEANSVCMKFNDLTKTIMMLDTALRKLGVSVDLVKYFSDWDNLITNQNTISRRLIKIEDEYKEKSEELLSKARKTKDETGVDIIKDKYGGNNDKTRRQYIKESLIDLSNEKQELTLQKEDNARRISYLKKLIDLHIELIKYGGNDELPETE